MPIAMMDKATPTSRARKPFFFLAKNLNDLSSFLRKKKMEGMDPSLKATLISSNVSGVLWLAVIK